MTKDTACLILSITPHFSYKRFLHCISLGIDLVELVKNPSSHIDTLKLKLQSIEFLQNKNYSKYLEQTSLWLDRGDKFNIISYFDEKYPANLKEIATPPIALYCLGDVELLNSTQLAIVGSRKNTSYGESATRKIVADLVSNNITITSGLAYGIDTLSHKYTLDNNGKTIAVIGTGIDVVYPATNKSLAHKVAESGLIISEFSFGTKPQKHNFPQRNRVISALAKGTLVIEAASKSGSLITAKYALEQNKEIFAIPGSIFSGASEGCNELIQQGAKLVCNVDDILTELNISKQTTIITKNKSSLSNEQQAIYDLLNHESITTIDQIINTTALEYTKVNEILFELEMEDLIKSKIGGYIKL